MEEAPRRSRFVRGLIVILSLSALGLGLRVYEQSRALGYLRAAQAASEAFYEADRDHRATLNRKRVAAIAALRSDLAGAKQALEAQRARAKRRPIPFRAPAAPSIEGKVVAVKADITPALVLLSVGSDDQVQVGFHFTIYRSNHFVAKVVVERVLQGSAGCRVLFTGKGQTIRQGDRAATVLQ